MFLTILYLGKRLCAFMDPLKLIDPLEVLHIALWKTTNINFLGKAFWMINVKI